MEPLTALILLAAVGCSVLSPRPQTTVICDPDFEPAECEQLWIAAEDVLPEGHAPITDIRVRSGLSCIEPCGAGGPGDAVALVHFTLNDGCQAAAYLIEDEAGRGWRSHVAIPGTKSASDLVCDASDPR